MNVKDNDLGIKHKEDVNANNDIPGIKNKEDMRLNNNDTLKEDFSLNACITGIKNATLNNDDTEGKGVFKVAAAVAASKLDKESQSDDDEDWEDTFESAESMPSLIKIVDKKHCNMQRKKGGESQIDGRRGGGRRLAAF